MFSSILVWLKSLSLAGKIGIISLGLISVGVATSTPTETKEVNPATFSQVKAEEKTLKTIQSTEAIPFTRKTVETASLNKGDTKVSTVGVDGVRTLSYELTLINGVETGRRLLADEVTTPAIEEITSIGTYVAPEPVQIPPSSNCDPNYTPCVPNVSYDLDCPDIGFSVRVIGSDPHGFDRDRDGYGCESY